MTEMEIALLAALVKVVDGYITPLQTRIKCWKYKETQLYFIVGMSIPQFDGTTDTLDWDLNIEHWDKFNIIEVNKNEVPLVADNSKTIEKLYKI